MLNAGIIRSDFERLATNYGHPVMLRYYVQATASGTSVYDDDITITQSGSDVWTVGMVFDIANAKRGSFEANLLEQGKLQADDMSCYIPGYISVSGIVKIGFGSPIDDIRFIIYPGADTRESVNNIRSYHKVYTRVLPGGSFIGEA